MFKKQVAVRSLWKFSPTQLNFPFVHVEQRGKFLILVFTPDAATIEYHKTLAGIVPRYYFHIRDKGDNLVEDPAGVSLADLDVASDQCGQIVRDVLSEDPWLTEALAGRRFEITDEGGRTILVLPFANIGMRAERRFALRPRR